ncbi:PREDICTED: 45 kDa calcium-binding protein-like [Priapulus caudatus]|uniref:45 kDa calcium-binding protein n=1 Tax=Priapulus caudatus TaxID=37621 RepID=A0ABM1DX24_PRICU|nr:PREDICTED: 45 kDa calcium-binding protein-like [Priapulus caudatus]
MKLKSVTARGTFNLVVISAVIYLQCQCCNAKPLLKGKKPHSKEVNSLPGEHLELGPEAEDLHPPDHIAGLKIERDGHVNKDFHQEVVMGNVKMHPDDPEVEQTQKLTDIFHRMDTDDDNFITLEELETWIKDKVEEHMDEAVEQNNEIFLAIDSDKDGALTWSEYHQHFLVHKGGVNEKYAKLHQQIHNGKQEHNDDLDYKYRDEISQDNFRWTEADEDHDKKLSSHEFLGFRHPEHSKVMLESMVRDILASLDSNKDGQLTAEEFAMLPPGEVDEKWQEQDRAFQQEREKEFHEHIDIDHNGVASFDELMAYTDPRNSLHAKNEAFNLLQFADRDHDGRLSLAEMLDMRDLFLGSNVANPAQSFHDEF